jgi:hypothetical protein
MDLKIRMMAMMMRFWNAVGSRGLHYMCKVDIWNPIGANVEATEDRIMEAVNS